MNKIAIIVTTFCRDSLLKEAVASMEKYAPENAIILIADQGCKYKKDFLAKTEEYKRPKVRYYNLPFDCGLSASRNFLVDKAQELGCNYCVIASDAMIFTEKTKDIDKLIQYMDKYDCIGCNLNKSEIYWTGWISLIPGQSFCLDFIDRSKICNAPNGIFDCSIIHNFFIAKTESLLKVRWDETLKLGEHEDFFYRYTLEGFKTGWTANVSCDRVKSREGQHGLYRQKNWNEGIQKLKEKWGIKSWITYLNRNNGFWGGTKYLLDRRK